jgi:tRNA (guanine37-N1)-methyltransferase
VENEKISIEAINIRDFSTNKHKKVDDYPYGGGAGMLMQAQPVYDAYESVCKNIPEHHKKRVIYVTPQGYPFTQRMAEDFAKNDDLIFICGHYEGIDERVLEEVVTDYVSIGDYILTGGELASMVMVDAISRLVPGVLHNDLSAETESFHGYLLEYPQYSRPEEWHYKKVPEVLLSGNQRKIDEWRLQQSKMRTMERRPDLFEQYWKLQECKEFLVKQKLLHIDMIELINRGNAIYIASSNNDILLQDKVTGNFYHTGDDFDFFMKLPKNVRLAIKNIAFHQQDIAHRIKRILSLNTELTCYQAVYTQKERLSINGLYRADGQPTSEGLLIRSLTEEHIGVVVAEYPDEDYVRERIKNGCMFGAFVCDALVGFVGIHDDGCLGMLHVLEEYRGRNIGKALAVYIINKALEMGWIPYAQFKCEDEISVSMQETLGLYMAKTPVVWMWRE